MFMYVILINFVYMQKTNIKVSSIYIYIYMYNTLKLCLFIWLTPTKNCSPNPPQITIK